MTQPINYIQQSPELFQKPLEISNQLKNGVVEKSIRDLMGCTS